MDLRRTQAVALRQGRELTEEQVSLLGAFVVELYLRNEATNLTRVPQDECDLKHLADSLLVSEFCEEGVEVLDIGPGPGFPSWVLAACRPDLRVTSVESQGKMVRTLGHFRLSNLKILEQRAEEDVQREAFGVVTGRAVAPFAVQAEISAPWVRVGGIFVPFRTPAEEEEIRQFNAGVLGLELEALEQRDLPESDIVRLFPVFRKVKETAQEFPRAWGRIKVRPLS